MSTRFDAQPGTIVTLRASFKQSDVLFDPFSVGPVVIRNAAGAVVATVAVASVVRESLGTYYVTYSIPSGSALGLWTDTWTYVVLSGGTSVSKELSFAVNEACATSPGDLWQPLTTYASFLDPVTTYTDSELQSAALTAQEIIEKLCGRLFVPRAESIDLDGTGKPYLMMPEDRNVLAVSSIYEITDGSTLSVIDISQLKVYGTHVVLGDWQPAGDFGAEDCQPTICGVDGLGVFTLGRLNIRVSGTFGDYASVPRPILRATGLLTARIVEEDYAPEAYSQESVSGDHSGTMRQGVVGAAIGGMTGFGDIDALVALYRKRAPVVSVI